MLSNTRKNNLIEKERMTFYMKYYHRYTHSKSNK